MLFHAKLLATIILLYGLFSTGIFCRNVRIGKLLNDAINKNDTAITTLQQYANRKKLPVGFELQALTALSHFPELKNVPIEFRIKKSYATLKTRPSFLSMFMPKGSRSYIITISDKSIDKLNPLLLEHLPNDAQIGVLGHELSHVVDFSKETMLQGFRKAIGHLSNRYIDKMEYNTDKICIQHGLGKNLESWSEFIRKTMKTTYWRGADFVTRGDNKYERYMNPDTIERYMSMLNSSPPGFARSSTVRAK